MIIAACVDEAMGLQFNHRRQSRDRALMEELLRMASGRLRMSEASGRLLPEGGAYLGADYLCAAQPGDWCFCEDCAYLEEADAIEAIVLFQWNRTYPADLWFQFPGDWKMTQSREFAGSSHEKITVEVYTK